MKTEVIKQKKNPFLEREEITLEITNEISPTFDEVKAELKKDKDLTVIKKVNGSFGKQSFTAEIFVYDNIEAKNKIETVPQKVRKKMEADNKAAAEADKKAKAAAKKAEEEAKKAEETPVKEIKEETPTVEKTE